MATVEFLVYYSAFDAVSAGAAAGAAALCRMLLTLPTETSTRRMPVLAYDNERLMMELAMVMGADLGDGDNDDDDASASTLANQNLPFL